MSPEIPPSLAPSPTAQPTIFAELKKIASAADTTGMTGMVSQIHLIANSLAGTELNHQVISQNIANVNTPGYKAQTVDFEKFLKQVADGTADRKMLDSIPVNQMEGLFDRQDGNNVDLDSQVGAMKKNALLFQTYSQLLASKMATARRAITG